MVYEPEQLGNEMLQVNSQDASSTNVQAEAKKLQVYTRSRRKSVNPSVLSGTKGTRKSVDSFAEENPEDGDQGLSAMTENIESDITTRVSNSRSKKLSTPDIKIPDASDVDLTTPRFVGIATPAPKERVRKSTKRKCIIDEATYLPTKVMRGTILDATDLVSKRRKVSYTALDIWRSSRHLFDPLLTGISPELRTLFHLEKLKMPKFSSKTIDSLERLDVDVVNVSTPVIPVQVVITAPETPSCCSVDIPEPISIAPETPIQRSTITRAYDVPMSPGTPNYESARPCMFESPRREPSPSTDQESDFNLTAEISSYSEENCEWDGWSSRSRAVAKYFHGAFLKRKEREEEETLNLSTVVKGKTKKESSRLFYEVLVLSSNGLVDVKQGHSYGDILVGKLEKLDPSTWS